MIKYILLDLDDTILDFSWAEHQALGRTMAEFGVEATDELRSLYSRINLEYWRQLERKEITREALQVNRFRRLQEEIRLEGDPVVFADTYVKYLSQGHCFLPGALETLRVLKKNHRLFIVTNGTAVVQYGRLKSAGITDFFEKIFISEEVGSNKPHAEFFDRCFESIEGFNRSEAIIVGDSLHSDILGGINAGILTCWINFRHHPERADIQPDYQIETLSQLLSILEKLNK